jgi:hypothetical protein
LLSNCSNTRETGEGFFLFRVSVRLRGGERNQGCQMPNLVIRSFTNYKFKC